MKDIKPKIYHCGDKMNQKRVFILEVTECRECFYYEEEYDEHRDQTTFSCGHHEAKWQKLELAKENREAITPSCPMYKHSFLKSETKPVQVKKQ